MTPVTPSHEKASVGPICSHLQIWLERRFSTCIYTKSLSNNIKLLVGHMHVFAWALCSHGLCAGMGSALAWVLCSHELCARMGSVLSPVLFLLVMDHILLELQSKSNGLNISGLFLGALSHADDIRTLSTNLTDCRAQISSVSSFTTQRGLTLSTEKGEAIISPSAPANKSYIQVDDIKIPISHSARCLGAWWTSNLSSSKWITVNINKAR